MRSSTNKDIKQTISSRDASGWAIIKSENSLILPNSHSVLPRDYKVGTLSNS